MTQKLTTVSRLLPHYPPFVFLLFSMKKTPIQNTQLLAFQTDVKNTQLCILITLMDGGRGAVEAVTTHPVIIKLGFSHSSGWPETEKVRVQHPLLLCSGTTDWDDAERRRCLRASIVIMDKITFAGQCWDITEFGSKLICYMWCKSAYVSCLEIERNPKAGMVFFLLFVQNVCQPLTIAGMLSLWKKPLWQRRY